LARSRFYRAEIAIRFDSDILASVTKRLIEVDDDKLDAVRVLLGTRTLKATVDEAFDEVLALEKRRQALLAERGVEIDPLADAAVRRDAWA
jgi:Arc/MetJ family transcription regulator